MFGRNLNQNIKNRINDSLDWFIFGSSFMIINDALGK